MLCCCDSDDNKICFNRSMRNNRRYPIVTTRFVLYLHSPAGDIQVTHCEALHGRVLEEITLTVTVVHGKLQSQFWGFCASDENSVHF